MVFVEFRDPAPYRKAHIGDSSVFAELSFEHHLVSPDQLSDAVINPYEFRSTQIIRLYGYLHAGAKSEQCHDA